MALAPDLPEARFWTTSTEAPKSQDCFRMPTTWERIEQNAIALGLVVVSCGLLWTRRNDAL
jgi:hypothetical protein